MDLLTQRAVVTLGYHPNLATLGAVLVLLSAVAFLSNSHGAWKHLPPGPRGIPLLGNVSQLLGDKWLTFTALKEKYGPIVHLTAAGQHIIVLNNLKVASDLMDRKSSVTSHRPQNIVVGIMTGNLLITFLNPGDVWHRMRRASQEGLRSSSVPLYYPALYREAVSLSVKMLSDPSKMEWYGHIQGAVAGGAIRMIYGRSSEEDVSTLNEYVKRLTMSATSPAAHLVDVLPWLNVFPAWMSPWKKMAQRAFETDSGTFKKLFRETERRGMDTPSMVNTLTKNAKSLGLAEEEEYWLAGAVFTGSQTIIDVLSWWLMAMLLYPETQQRAHDEIDHVIAKGRLPTFEDCKKMPYMQAMVKEVIRWRPIDPLGLPHTTSEDIWYEGFFIPKGSMLVPNVWAINRDPDTFGPDAHHFNPARHLDDTTGNMKPSPADTKEEGHVSFGFGRRICVGRHFANKMLLINMVLLAWATKIDAERGPDGRPIGLDVDGCVDEGVTVRPVPFPCNITPRFPGALSMLHQGLAELRLHE
ncbi:cytochrome P450 [Lasiosphaeria hispida]|uniref:Cytochrome P450 n=1 Tax=Lasiosphaeria hispida TaxID=260671 RepID=A0AAJ0HA51_9PEZI|nr:cytochrome P450 [Lasiosphaeria hispida]